MHVLQAFLTGLLLFALAGRNDKSHNLRGASSSPAPQRREHLLDVSGGKDVSVVTANASYGERMLPLAHCPDSCAPSSSGTFAQCPACVGSHGGEVRAQKTRQAASDPGHAHGQSLRHLVPHRVHVPHPVLLPPPHGSDEASESDPEANSLTHFSFGL